MIHFEVSLTTILGWATNLCHQGSYSLSVFKEPSHVLAIAIADNASGAALMRCSFWFFLSCLAIKKIIHQCG